MAGFLRKKSTQDATTSTKPNQHAQVSVGVAAPGNSPSLPPLYARFSTLNQGSAANVAPRIVSAPMALSSNVRKDTQIMTNQRTRTTAAKTVTPVWGEDPTPESRNRGNASRTRMPVESWYKSRSDPEPPGPSPPQPRQATSRTTTRSVSRTPARDVPNSPSGRFTPGVTSKPAPIPHSSSSQSPTYTAPPTKPQTPPRAIMTPSIRYDKPLPQPLLSSSPPSRQALDEHTISLTESPHNRRVGGSSPVMNPSVVSSPPYAEKIFSDQSPSQDALPQPPTRYSLTPKLAHNRQSLTPVPHPRSHLQPKVDAAARRDLGTNIGALGAHPVLEADPSQAIRTQVDQLPSRFSTPPSPPRGDNVLPNAIPSPVNRINAAMQPMDRDQEYNSNTSLPSLTSSPHPQQLEPSTMLQRFPPDSQPKTKFSISAPEQRPISLHRPATANVPDSEASSLPKAMPQASNTVADPSGDPPEYLTLEDFDFHQNSPQLPNKSFSIRSPTTVAAPVRGRPLIFATMESAVQESPFPATATLERSSQDEVATSAYPSPPVEHGFPRPRSVVSSAVTMSGKVHIDILPPGSSQKSVPQPQAWTPPSTPPKEHHNSRHPNNSPQTVQTFTRENSRRTSELPVLADKAMDRDPQLPQPIQSVGSGDTVSTVKASRKPSKVAATSRTPTAISAGNPMSSGYIPEVSHGHHPRLTPQKARPSTPGTHTSHPLIPPVPDDTRRISGMLLDDDPFARLEGVRMLKPPSRDGAGGSATSNESLSNKVPAKDTEVKSNAHSQEGAASTLEAGQFHNEGYVPPSPTAAKVQAPPSPPSPDDYKRARARRRGEGLEKVPPTSVADLPVREDRTPTPFPMEVFLANANILSTFLSYLSFYEWTVLSSSTKQIRSLLWDTEELREVVLERYLSTVGYARWTFEESCPLSLSLKDLHDYMRGVSTPSHEYARLAGLYLQSRMNRAMDDYETIQETARSLTASTRAYTRVVLRLRAQAEAESNALASKPPSYPPSAMNNGFASPGSASRSSSRAPSPSSFSHSQHSHTSPRPTGLTAPSPTFRSPLFRLRRAPLLRVFVPSQDEWLSDANVIECENELNRAGVLGMMRLGDVVWDVAVGDEGNVGRLIWDGSYLLDLDYTYSSVGDLPKYMHTLAFPPSYFHRVIRTGAPSSNPTAHIDISPWGEEIAANLQLLSDRVRTETPQGAYHNVVRWIHRSSFTIRPPNKTPPRTNPRSGKSAASSSGRIPIPDADGLYVDPGWYGTIVVETEGTNEALADLQDRCGPGAFPPRALATHEKYASVKDKESKKVFQILRERSRPGEIWIRAVSAKERLL